MVVGIDHQMGPEAGGPLGRAPRFTHKAVYVGSQHRASVVEAKERVEFDLLELPLSA